MATYQELYDKGLPYFDNDVLLVEHALQQNHCVALCSAYKMGDRRFVDYFYSIIAHEDRFDVYYDVENTYTAETLQKIQQTKTTRHKILLLPWYFRANKSFQREYLSLVQNKLHTFTSVIILESSFLEHPEIVFPRTNIPFELTLTRKPLSKSKLLQLLSIREQLAEQPLTTSQSSTIYKLSGGHIGLAKRLFTLVTQSAPLTTSALLTDPAVKNDLLNLELEYRTLSPETNLRLGLTKPDGSIAIPLLSAFIERIEGSFSDSLPPLFQKLLALFLENEGNPVTKEEIHRVMSQERDYSLWAVYKTIERFSRAVSKKYIVRNVSGKGYLLVTRTR